MRRLSLIGGIGLLLLSVSTTFAGTGTSVWQTKVHVGSVVGGATLAQTANGKAASVAVKLYNVKPATKITVSLNEGACPSTTTIARRLTFKAPSAGPSVHRFWLTTAELATLKADIAKKDAFSVTITAIGKTTDTACTTLTTR